MLQVGDGEGDLSQQLVGLQAVALLGALTGQEVVDVHGALAPDAAQGHVGVQGHAGRQAVTGHGGLGDVAADGAQIPDLGRAHLTGGVVEDAGIFLDVLVGGDLGVGSHGADVELTVLHADVIQFLELLQVHDDSRAGLALVQLQGQVGAAGDGGDAVLVLIQQRKSLIHSCGRVKIKGLHSVLLSLLKGECFIFQCR